MLSRETVAQQRDGWLSIEMGGNVERWVAKQRDGWLRRKMREMGGLVE